MPNPRLISPTPEPGPVSNNDPCPECGRSDALRMTRADDGRRVTCRFVDQGLCKWPGNYRPFRRPKRDSLPTPFIERLAHIAERVIDECSEHGAANARIDPQYVTSLRSAVRRVARDRGISVRTTHLGDGQIEVRVG